MVIFKAWCHWYIKIILLLCYNGIAVANILFNFAPVKDEIVEIDFVLI